MHGKVFKKVFSEILFQYKPPHASLFLLISLHNREEVFFFFDDDDDDSI